jgi:hypothetical protein
MSRPDARKVIIVVAVVAVLAAAGFGAYWYLSRRDQPAKTPADTSEDTQQVDERPVITTETKHYESPAFSLEFDYPKDWTITEGEDGGQVIAASPAMRLDTADGQAITGKVVFTIRNKQQPLPEFDKGNAAAVRESEKIMYLKPSSVQRGSTYMSFLRYAGNYGSGKLDGVFITGDVGYVVSQAIPMADFVPVDPVISISFLQCSNTTCSGQSIPVGVMMTLWDETDFSTPLRDMLQSLTIN